MKGWINLLAILLVILIVWIVCLLNDKKSAKKERKNLLKEKKQLLIRQKIKERLQVLLNRRFKWRLYFGYTVFLIAFVGLAIVSSKLLNFGDDVEGVLYGAGTIELLIFVVTLYKINEAHEFKYLMNQFAPFLKKRIFGKDINIDKKIRKIKNKITKIDKRILVLDKIIAA